MVAFFHQPIGERGDVIHAVGGTITVVSEKDVHLGVSMGGFVGRMVLLRSWRYLSGGLGKVKTLRCVFVYEGDMRLAGDLAFSLGQLR